MDEVKGESKRPEREPNNSSHDEGLPRRKQSSLDWSFWSDHPVAIILFFLAAILLSPITDFMDRTLKIWSCGFGVWLIFGTVVAFFCHSVSNTAGERADPDHNAPVPDVRFPPERSLEPTTRSVAPATRPPTTSSIGYGNPDRTFVVMPAGLSGFVPGDRFTENDFRNRFPAPAFHPGLDQATALHDHYEQMLDRLLKLNAIQLLTPKIAETPINLSNPGRTFEVIPDGFGPWLKGQKFTDYEFRQRHPAPVPHPGEDPVVSRNDYYNGLLNTHLKNQAIRVVPTPVA